ncbi:MAG: uracil phosphoribosyltransferase [Bacteroidales bacterium]|jgi:uracil phosphoribosyltransferase|nr:uracil phosphoribosyltransferase [Bacteroidales bacterium]MDD2823570.1 uracil phosphoribosyltransferase [Bacteroidales bacterium]MDD3100663.1 uracil phosphoribosyltransferase [Bacteroidales bacterium]MDD3639592.1 uracil phosphoribosyltransferase [Bacteroidales bacterium]MDD3944278.1 uracil phosphoribosyltransferase [Bacteroidales bacterium]
MITYVFAEKDSLFNAVLAEMRDVNIQKDSMRFRYNLERLGYMFAYEISKTLTYREEEVQTPLGISNCRVLNDQVVLATVLRAGLPLHEGMLKIFDKAQNAFVAAFRKYGRNYKFTIQLEYMASPSLEDKVLILSDPMLATGSTIYLTYQEMIQQKGTPKHCHIVSPIASREGYEYLCRKLPQKGVSIWLGAIDEELTTKSYIVPGLGDAGDLAYGEK